MNPSEQPRQPQESQQLANLQPTTQIENPGQLFGILSLVSTFLGLSLVGAILGYVSSKKSNEAGQSPTLGKIGMWVGIIFTILSIVFIGIIAMVAYSGIQERARESATQSQAAAERRKEELRQLEQSDDFSE